MKKKISKELILSTCMQKQEELIHNFDTRVNEMRTDAYSQSQSASQSEDHTAGDVEVLSTLAGELEFAQLEMEVLKSLNANQVNDIVEPGAVVVTNQRTFYIAVSTEKVEIEGEVIFGISVKAPIYAAMSGLKKGDKFEFNGTSYKIEKVY